MQIEPNKEAIVNNRMEVEYVAWTAYGSVYQNVKSLLLIAAWIWIRLPC